MNKDESGSAQVGHLPHRARVPGFVKDEELGLGDLIKRVTSTFGIKPCGSCQRRAATLNRWFIVTGRAR
jgi:hypothetical protein